MAKSSVVLMLFLCAIPTFAQMQSARGAIQGTVIDSSASALPGARVLATQIDSGLVRESTTDIEGKFRFTALQVGTYQLRVEHEGFSTAVLNGISVSVGQTVVQRIEMKLSQVVERLEVIEQADSLDIAATSASVALGNERVEETPSQNRNYLNIVLTAPGVASSAGSSAQRSSSAVRSASTDSGFSFGGMRGRNNSLSIDGVDNRDETTGGSRVAVGLEMVKEFRVSGTSFSAETGGAAGGSVNLVTLSGTNKWHGDGTFFTQNEFANARNPEADVKTNPTYRRYQPGVSLNGPITRDRTFFSLALEQEWESSEEFSETPKILVPTLKRGLFPASSSQTEFSVKVNHQIGSKHTLSARYAFSRGRTSHDMQDVDNFTDSSARGSSLTRDHSFVADWIYVITPSLVNDLRGQLSERSVGITPNSTGPMYEIPGVITFGQSYRLNAARTEKHTELVDSIHIVHGHHQISFGASLHTIHFDANIQNRFGGIYIYPTLDHYFANSPDLYIQAIGNSRTRFHTLPLGLWMQDRWQISSGLSLDTGLRYDHQWLPGQIPGTNRNVAPRIGLAWHPTPDSPYVFRTGFGIFFDRYPLSYLNDAIQLDGTHAYEAIRYGSGPLLQARYQTAPNFPATFSRKFSAGAERSLGKDTTLSVEYASVIGRNLPRTRNVGSGVPVFQIEQTAKSTFNGLSLALNRRLTKEIAYLVSYNLATTHDDASDYDEQPLNPQNLQQEWALSRQHQRHRFAASGLFEIVDNLTLAPIFTYGSGRPLNSLDTTDTFRTGAYPLSARPLGLGRNAYLAPGTASLDARLMKTFPVPDKRAVLQMGIESFNILNHTNPLRVSPYYAAEGQKLNSFRSIVEMLNARQVQFFIQFEY
jgi:outer membrane receptor for ferrienterochelin and colicin